MTAVIQDDGFVCPPAGLFSFQLAVPATAGQLLFLLVVGAGSSFAGVTIEGDGGRPYWSTTNIAGSTYAELRMYVLETGDEYVTATPTPVTAAQAIGWVLIDGAAIISDDWVLYANSEDPGDICQTVAYTAADEGLVIGMAVITAGSSVAITEPYDWTLIDAGQTDPFSGCFAWGVITATGAQIPEFFPGTIPAGTTGDVYWWPVYDLGLRIRDGQSTTSTSSGAVTSQPGAVERPLRLFPEPPPLPAEIPDPTGIVTPTAPWVPGTGPYRSNP